MNNQQEIFLRDVMLNQLNTFGFTAKATFFSIINQPKDILPIITTFEWHELEHCILGNGSNIVFTGDFKGIVLQVKIKFRALVREDNDAWIIRVGAGENWHNFVCWTLRQGWPGLENLILIPGTAGAAPVQNIGAYGIEISERFESLEAIDLETGNLVSFDKIACEFSYRDSLFKKFSNRYLITAIILRLPKHWKPVLSYAGLVEELENMQVIQPTAINIAKAVMLIRRRKLPHPNINSAGSFFKNPTIDQINLTKLIIKYPKIPYFVQSDGIIRLSAGWLIEYCGWKGKHLGSASVYQKQALVLVNNSSSNCQDLLTLAIAIQQSVYKTFGVTLVPEPVLV